MFYKPAIQLWANIVMSTSIFHNYWDYEKILKQDLPILKRMIKDIIVNSGGWWQADLTPKQIKEIADYIYEVHNEQYKQNPQKTYSQLAGELLANSIKKNLVYEDYIGFVVKASKFKKIISKYASLIRWRDRQNDAPTFKQFFNFMKPNDYVIGYVITELRKDKRISIEGLVVKGTRRALNLSDMGVYPADEVINNYPFKGYTWVWWD